VSYILAIAGFQPDIINRPLFRIKGNIDEVVLLITHHSKSIETYSNVTDAMKFYGVRCRAVQINDIFSFFEVLASIELIIEQMGKPEWINVSAGPGIAISALTFSAIKHNVPVAFYNRENDMTSMVDISKSKDLFNSVRKNLTLLNSIKDEPLSIEEISRKTNLSKSTVSRRVTLLSKFYLVEKRKSNRKLIVQVTEVSKMLLKKRNLE
jgi:CRISPR locus-related DNA-binding protein